MDAGWWVERMGVGGHVCRWERVRESRKARCEWEEVGGEERVASGFCLEWSGGLRKKVGGAIRTQSR